MPLVRTQDLTKEYGSAAQPVRALDRVNFAIEAGECVAIMGPSGSGKSTLLHLLGGLDRPTRGTVWLREIDLSTLSDEALSRLRREQLGFVFQFFNLLPVLNARENVALPLLLDGVPRDEALRRADAALERVGLADRALHRPAELSGGEQQRVAIARALVTEPTLILADEPTGNLDSQTSDEIIHLLRRSVDEWGRTLVIVTHDPRIAAHADRIVFLKDGRIVDENRLSGQGDAEELRARLARVSAS
ncbi:ABC transporter ATP-binding protein [Kallotenue papyrolyticum]|uniref:ABC transporter ATP-binding protein n=1 Tax=Kallotenue papyrolyticum TaxID=1325125 RepID=UPI0004785C3A|nr:ABC transporter ATP-binding protein [Kallotenue papyrolyticum]